MPTLKNIIPLLQEALPTVLSLRNSKELKSDDSYVSKGDLYLDKLVQTFLVDNWGDIQIVSEETHKGNHVDLEAAAYTAVVDPIDGTENFVSGLREWGVGICIFKGETHVESMIALPELNEYICTGDRFERFESRISGLSSSLTKEHLMALEPGFEYRIIGCCMYNMLQVVKGSFHTFSNPKGANAWDILPGMQLALENKLNITIDNIPYHGEFLQPTQKYCFSIRNI
jgi:fructose-1,6-bisphosphatase/inositol monophosphatase family enzyme